MPGESIEQAFIAAQGAVQAGDRRGAIGHLRSVLAIEPNAAEALGMLANLLREEREFNEAQEICIRLIQLYPGYPGAPELLGLCYLDQGLAHKALEFFQLAVTYAPDVTEFHYNLGKAYEKLVRIEDAVTEYHEAIRLSPANPMLYETLAKMLIKHGLKAEGFENRRRAIELNPTREGFAVLAASLMDDNRFEEAEMYCRRAIELDQSSADSYERLGYVLQILGRFEESLDYCSKAIELDPEMAAAYLGYTSAKRITLANNDVIARLEEMAHDERRNKVDLRRLNYALGKAHADLGQFEQAMACYDRANAFAFETELRGRVFDWSNHRMWTDLQIETFTPRFFSKNRHLGSDSEQPIFILGMIRSGTTLIEQILSSHPQVGAGGEIRFWADSSNERLVHRLKAGTVTTADASGTAADYLARLEQIATGNPHVTDKMPQNYLMVGLIHLLFPKARIIHCRRNPIDTCLSIWTTPNIRATGFCHVRHSIVQGYREYLRIMEHWRRVIPPDVFLEVDYEDVVANREGVTRRMITFCSLPWDDACLHHEQNDRPIRTPSLWQARQPIYTTSVEKWRQYEPWLGEFASLG